MNARSEMVRAPRAAHLFRCRQGTHSESALVEFAFETGPRVCQSHVDKQGTGEQVPRATSAPLTPALI